LFWGIIDSCIKNIEPCLLNNCASQFFPENIIQEIQKIAVDTIKGESSLNNFAKSFLEVIALLTNLSFEIAKEPVGF